MRKQTSIWIVLPLLSALFFAWVVYLLSLPGPLVHNMPPFVRVVRHAVLEPRPKKRVWTAEDRTVQKQIEQMLMEREPPMQMVFDRVKVMNGRIVEEHPDYVVFAEHLGDSGEMSVAISRDRIVRLESRDRNVPEITLRDVRFRREFPEKQFYKRPPYTIVTDETFLAVNRMVEEQRRLCEQFTKWMGPLISESACHDDMQLLIFSDHDEYQAYRLGVEGIEKNAAGFYSINSGRLVVSHQRNADWVKMGRKQISEIAQKKEEKIRTNRGRYLLGRWKQKAGDQLNAQASVTTENILRHEGAHQLTYTLGVQNRFQHGRGWISEGLATFFETGIPGGANVSRSLELQAALNSGDFIPLWELLAAERCETALQYAQAWSLVCMLMQPTYQPGFFAYLDQVRQNPELPLESPIEELCRFLPLVPDELEIYWQAFIREK